MAKSVKKVMLIGWDGAPPQMVERMMAKGLLKNFASLRARGTYIRALNPYPTITASNWTTLSTGAWPGRHGVTAYYVHHPGDPLDKVYTGFNTAECSTELIWDSAERNGKKCLLVHYETSWPSTLKKGVVVGGCGPNYEDEFFRITPDIIFSQERYPGSRMSEPVEIGKEGAKNKVNLCFHTDSGEEKTYFAEWSDEDRLLAIYKDESGKHPIAKVAEKGWSDPVADTFLLEKETVDAAFRFFLEKLPSEDDEEFMLLCTSIMPVRKIADPPEVGEELVAKLGPYYPRGGWESAGALSAESYLVYLDKYHDWLAGACEHLMKEEWDLLYTQTHCHDYVHHIFMRCYDPITASEQKRWNQEQCEGYVEQAYESADRMLGRILQFADQETLIAVVSDHGATTWLSDVNIRDILIDASLMKIDSETGRVIWEKTKAVPQRACYVYVNVKGRDPDGIVEPGEEYEDVRDRIIEAFYDYVEPNTGKRPFSLVLKKEDARVLGQYGPRVGDIVYALHTQYGHEHGQGLSTARWGRGSLESVILLAGPGIKKNFRHEGMTGIQDVVPTLCYMADIPFPRGCEGAIIYDALEDPGFKMKEKEKLERELQRWKDEYERNLSLTHNRS